MNSDSAQKKCLACEQSSDVTPLIMLEYKGNTLWICAQHFPILIHNPAKLAGKLQGAENMEASEHCH